MTKMRLELLGCETISLEGMYRSQRHDVLTPQSSPESRSVHQEQRSSTDSSQSDMYPLDQPTFDLDHLPLHIPTILHCKCRMTDNVAPRSQFRKCDVFQVQTSTLIFSVKLKNRSLQLCHFICINNIYHILFYWEI